MYWWFELKLLHNFHDLLIFGKVLNPVGLPGKMTSERQKGASNLSVFYTFDFAMCFVPERHALFEHLNFRKSERGAFVRFDLDMCLAPQRHALFGILTSTSGPNMVCFVHFDSDMCFVPQRCAFF